MASSISCLGFSSLVLFKITSSFQYYRHYKYMHPVAVINYLPPVVNSTNCLINSVTQEEGEMTRGSIMEYVKAVRGRYIGGPKKEKGKILDE